MPDTHMWLVTKLGRGGSEDTPKVIARNKDDAKQWIAEQDPTLEIGYDRDSCFYAEAISPYRVARYIAWRLPVVSPLTNSPDHAEETSR